ncbi:hypothetical protein ABPG74_014232 [Tetrahymena malaccensis]
MNSTQGRNTIFTNVDLRTIIPPKHHLKKSLNAIQQQQGFVPKSLKPQEIFEDGGKKKYEQNKSIDFSKSKIDSAIVQKKGLGTYNTEFLRRQLENNPSQNHQTGLRNQDAKKIKTYFNDPSIKLNTISKDFTVKPEDCSDSKVNSRPNYYLSSKNIQRTMNQDQFSQTGKINSRKTNLSMTSSNLNSTLDQYKFSNNHYDNSSANTASTQTVQSQTKASHQRCNTETAIFNQVPRNQYKNIHTNKVAVGNNGVGFYIQ